MGFWS